MTNIYKAILDGNKSAEMLLIQNDKPAGIIMYEDKDMLRFKLWLKKMRTKKTNNMYS